MFSSCRRLFQHRRSSSSRHKDRSRRHRIDRDAAAATPVPGHHYATQYHMIYLPSPASCVARYYFVARTGRRRSRPSVLARPRGCRRPVRTASPGSSPRRSPLLPHRRRAGAGRWGLLVFAPSALSFCAAWVLFELFFGPCQQEWCSIDAQPGRKIIDQRALGRREAKKRASVL